jgi:hypothetical protein
VFSILKEKLKLIKVWARWIPHLLTFDQKKERIKKNLCFIDLVQRSRP